MASFISDRSIVAVLPPGGKVLSVKKHGATNWSTGYKVTVGEGNKLHHFFLKLISRKNAAKMAEGEYQSAAALRECIPEHVCPALGWGTLASDPTRAFFLTQYRDLKERPFRLEGLVEPKELVKPRVLVKPEVLVPIMKRMHSSTSPNGMFGFPVQTFRGYTPIDNSWCNTWEEYFTRMFRNDILWEQSVRGKDPGFNEVAEEFFAKVVPRLLRPLETGGRKIEPVLVHGDLWDENIALDGDTPIIFDACCCYGHRELELATMNTPRYKMDREYIEEYIRLVGKSKPEEDFWDRLRIYTMHQDIVVAGLWPNWIRLRGVVKEQMHELLAKYPNGINDFAFAANNAISTGGVPNTISKVDKVTSGTLDESKVTPASSLKRVKL